MTLRFLVVFAFTVLAFSAFAADGNTEVDVAVLRTDVARGEIIAEADLEYKAIPQMRANASVVRAITDVAGMEARRTLKAGEIIRTNDLKRPTLVAKGSTVTMLFEAPGMRLSAIGRALAEGKRAYWVCPTVDESEKIDLAAAQARFEELRRKFGGQVDLVHGRMKGADKDAAMSRFAAGETRLLVATTVIEVGVDVPEATVMVIEHAERFGLAQLHQLRGRIGRGSGASTCLLLYKAPLGETAKARLAILRETEDGFRIAEEDLRLRGEGDLLGTRQSGWPGFQVARPEVHGKYLGAARDDAALILSRDPTLSEARGEALRHLLYIFGKDEAVKLIRAG